MYWRRRRAISNSTSEFPGGAVRVVGTDRAISFADLAQRAEPGEAPLAGAHAFTPPAATYPNGTHLAEVEIDPETGGVQLLDYVVVDDFGLTLNPLLLEGQVHGGAVQGIGQALMENMVYDADSGQPMSASLMDYALPRARRNSSLRARDPQRAVRHQSARRERGRRGRRDRLLPGRHERHRGRALARLPHPPHRHAGDAGEGVDRDCGRAARAYAVRGIICSFCSPIASCCGALVHCKEQ